MNMSVTELMDYRLENPDVDVKVDAYITEKLIIVLICCEVKIKEKRRTII